MILSKSAGFIPVSLLMVVGLLVSFQASAEVRVQTTEQKRKTVTKPDLNIAKRCIKKCRFASKSRACRERCKARLLERYYSKACCKTPVARCLACQNKMTETELCSKRPETLGCPQPKAPKPECCEEKFASCLACQQGITITKLCDSDPKIRGCGGAADHPCCREMKAQCVACNLGVTKQFFCEQNPDSAGCPKRVLAPRYQSQPAESDRYKDKSGDQ